MKKNNGSTSKMCMGKKSKTGLVENINNPQIRKLKYEPNMFITKIFCISIFFVYYTINSKILKIFVRNKLFFAGATACKIKALVV